MLPAGRDKDLVPYVDIHAMQIPMVPFPVPMPCPGMGMIYDPNAYLPGKCKVFIKGSPRAQAGSPCKATIPHIPMPSFWPPSPSNEGEIYMGSSKIQVDKKDAAAFMGIKVLTCQFVGMPAPPRKWKSGGAKSLLLPMGTLIAIPCGVFFGGAPTIMSPDAPPIPPSNGMLKAFRK